MKSSDPKQALNNIETVFPETIIDSVFEELTTNHPLLVKIKCNNCNWTHKDDVKHKRRAESSMGQTQQ